MQDDAEKDLFFIDYNSIELIKCKITDNDCLFYFSYDRF